MTQETEEIIYIDDLPTKKMIVGGLEIEVKDLGNEVYAMEDKTYHLLGEKIHTGNAKERKEVLDFLDKQFFNSVTKVKIIK